MAYTDISREETTFNKEVKDWIEETKTPRYAYITEHLISILKNMNLKNKRILELGCGISPYFKYLGGNKLYGLDISKALLDRNKFKKVKLVQGDVLKCSIYFKKKFDLVFMAGVMHHVNERDHDNALKEINKVLEKSGRLVIVEPNMVSITGFFYISRKIIERVFGNKAVTDISGFSSEEEKYIFPNRFSKLLKKNHFLIQDRYTIGLIRLPPIKLFKNIAVENLNKRIDYLLKKLKINLGTTVIFISNKII